MSLGRSITCDQCQKIYPISEEDYSNFTVPPGWVRTQVREPRRWSWSDDSRAYGYSKEGDFCSISCLNSWLYTVPFND